MDKAKPTGWTMAGAFDMYSPPQVGDFLVTGLFCRGDPKTWIAFDKSTETGADLGTYNGSTKDVPEENGLANFEIPSES
jgi:hypothetical protein